MAVSIIHRVTGSGMATVGTILLVWWLAALAGGKESYAQFVDVFTLQSGQLNAVGWVFGVGLTWALFQHIGNGIRHFFLDAGALFELKANKLSSIAVFVFAILATAAFWAYLIWGK